MTVDNDIAAQDFFELMRTSSTRIATYLQLTSMGTEETETHSSFPARYSKFDSLNRCW